MTDRAQIIGENIKRIRTKHNMTQQQFGSVIGKSQSMVYAYETGASIPPLEVMLKIVSIFNVSLPSIMGFDTSLPSTELVRMIFNFYANMPGDFDDEKRK